MLTVPAPKLRYGALLPGVAALEKPMSVALGPVLDGTTPVGPAQLRTFRHIAYRRVAPALRSRLDAVCPARRRRNWWACKPAPQQNRAQDHQSAAMVAATAGQSSDLPRGQT